MAHKKGAGSTDNGRDSHSKRLGVKMFGGERAIAGNILVRQRGTKYHPGENVYMGRDHTLHARIDGLVTFKRTKQDRTYVSITPADLVTNGNTVVPERLAIEKPAVRKTPVKQPEAMEEALAPVAEMEASAPLPEAEKVADSPSDIEAAPSVPEEETSTAAMLEAEPEEISASVAKKAPKADDLKLMEGIGPKIEQLLKEGGINTWVELAETPVDRLREILDAAGPRYQIHDPSTWPAQSKFAAAGKWEELKEYQDMLTGGRDVTE